MRTSQAARYARWSASAAFLLAAIVAGTYLYRNLQARQVRKHAPPPAPVAVQRRSSTFSFSKVEGNQTIFTVTALRATEFKESDRNILEDVRIMIFGRSGDRSDSIHTKSCEYRRDDGGIVCAGEVQIDLQSTQDARRQSAANGRKAADGVIHLQTRNVMFNRETGEAQTDQAVVIEFPQGVGRGTGVSYHSVSGIVQLEKNVVMTLTNVPSGSAGTKTRSHAMRDTASLELTGSRLEFMRETGLARLSGPVHATQGERELNSGMLELQLDAALHARKLSALSGGLPRQRPELVSKKKSASGALTADDLSVLLHPRGWIEKVSAHGGVHGKLTGPKDEKQFSTERAELAMEPKTRKPEQLRASEGTFIEIKPTLESGFKRLRTDALLVRFGSAERQHRTRVESAETLAPGTLEWQAAMQGSESKGESTRLSAQKISATFNPKGLPGELSAQGKAAVERNLRGHPLQTTSSNELRVKFATGGDWSEMNFTGNAELREGERIAHADQAQLLRATQTTVLTSNAAVTDGFTRTVAQRISFVQTTGEIQGDGKVASTDLAAGRSVVNLAPVPANITAEHLTGNSVTGRALYSGNARLWQGDSVIEAESIELLRNPKELLAIGNVIAEFPQSTGKVAASAATSVAGPSGKRAVTPGNGKRWRVRAGTLTYWGKEARARLEKNVDAKSQQEEIIAPAMDLYFSPSLSGGGSRQLSRAVATGGVALQEGERRGTAEQGEYVASEGKFVLSGGNPTLTGAFGDTTTGRKLTFFLTDDTIVVDSDNGTRTLTKHRVQK